MKQKKIACFFSGGYTELNAMIKFMMKINKDIEYVQLCPRGPRKSAAAIKSRELASIDKSMNGKTGESLIRFVLDFIETKRFDEEKYDAILIEDDKDDRFLSVESEGYSTIDRQSWNEYQEKLLIKIGSKRPNIPVFIMLAAPEVEAWFLADWENSFGNVYEEKLGKKQNKQFKYQFHQFVNQKILTDRYRSDLENYGYFNKSYHKLSEEIQKALLTNRFLYETDNSEEISVTYSKRNEGSRMLSTIEPDHVEKRCTYFFKEAYLQLKNFR